MKRSLFYFAWRELTRSPNFGKSLSTQIMLGFFALYMAANFLFLGFAIPNILAKEFPDADPVSKLNSYLLIYFGFDLLMRQMLQNLPTISFKPFIILNIKKSRITKYLLMRSVLHFFNFLPYFLVIPICFTLVFAHHPGIVGVSWLVGVVLMVFTNHFLSIFIKWWTNNNDYGFYVFVGLFAAAYGIDYFNLLDLTGAFGSFFDLIIQQQAWVLILLALPIGLYFLNFNYLRSKMYLNLVAQKQKDAKVSDFSWLSRFGDYAKFISLEMRLIWRNKRPRTQFLITIVFLFYGFLIYKESGGRGIPGPIFILGGLLMVSMFSISYGQFFPAWHSNYFPMLMVQNFRMKQFLQSFYFINLVVCLIYFLCTLPYALIDTKVIYYHSAMLIYHLGVNMNLIFVFGLRSSRKLDLGGNAMFNYQGMGAAQWLIAFPLLLTPVLIYVLFNLFLPPMGALAVLAGLGLVGILSQPYLFNYFADAYLKRKHQLIKNYKNS